MVLPMNQDRPPTAAADAGETRRAGAADIEIGSRIRRARANRRVTQEVLAERLGISSQQLQKYESGGNRISASRLVQLAKCLEVSTADLLCEPPSGRNGAEAVKPLAGQPAAVELVELVQCFGAICNPEARAKILEMARFFRSLEVR